MIKRRKIERRVIERPEAKRTDSSLPQWWLSLLLVCTAMTCGPAAYAAEDGPAPINHCPAVAVSEKLAPRLDESREKYLNNCLLCEEDRCRFITTLNETESRICQALYCLPLRINQRSAARMEMGADGYFEYEYALNQRGKAVAVRLLSDADSDDRRRIERSIERLLNTRKFLAIEAQNRKLRLEGLYGNVNVVGRKVSN